MNIGITKLMETCHSHYSATFVLVSAVEFFKYFFFPETRLDISFKLSPLRTNSFHTEQITIQKATKACSRAANSAYHLFFGGCVTVFDCLSL